MSALLVISGPTATGKSELAIGLAQHLNGEVINVDSVQVYRGFNVGTAKVPFKERGGIVHHLIDIRDASETYNASEFIRDAESSIDSVERNRKISILVGGTTMYITLLFHGLADLPERDQDMRSSLALLSSEELHSRLQELDPSTASRLHSNDRVRIIRALESYEVSGVKQSELLEMHRLKDSRHKGLFLVLCLPREYLYQRIDTRSEIMFRDGLIEETQDLLQQLGTTKGPLSSIGYAQVVKYLEGSLSKEEALSELKQETRRLAKQQQTFWRNEAGKRGWIVRPSPEEEGLELRSSDEFYRTHKRVQDFRVFDFPFAELCSKVKQRLDAPFERNEVWLINAASH